MARPTPVSRCGRFLNWQSHWTDDWSQSLEKAERHLDLALQKELRRRLRALRRRDVLFLRGFDRSAAEADAALNLNPNYALDTIREASFTSIVDIPSPLFRTSSRPCGSIQRCGRFTPIFSVRPIWSRATTKPPRPRSGNVSGSPPTDRSLPRLLAVALGRLGEAEEAKRVWGELIEINPKYSFAEHVGRLPFQNQADVERLSEGLGKAGIQA